MTSTKAIVVVSPPQIAVDLNNIVFPYIQDYANKVGADFFVSYNTEDFSEVSIVQKEVKQQNVGQLEYVRWSLNAKIEAVRRLKARGYTRILFLENDVLILQEAKDIFAETPEDLPAAFEEGNFKNEYGKYTAKSNLQSLAILLARLNNTLSHFNVPQFTNLSNYYNLGVYLVPTDLDLFKPPHIYWTGFLGDQDYLNLLLQTHGGEIYPLPQHFNHMLWEPLDKIIKKRPSFIHHAGAWQNNELLSTLKRHIVILNEEGMLDAGKAFESVSPDTILE